MGSTGIIRQGLRASLAAAIAAAALTGTASAQSPAADQYGPGTPPQGPPASPGQGQGNPPAQPPQNPPPDSPPGQGVAGETAEGGQGSGQGSGQGGGQGEGAPGRSSAPGGDQSTSSSDAAATAPTVFSFSFGPLSDEAEDDIEAAVALTGLVLEEQPLASEDAVEQFLGSDLADSFGDDPQAVGRALAAQLVSGTPLAQDAFAALFGAETEFQPVTHVILTKDIELSDAESKFLDGLAEGFLSTDIPLAFVERSDAEPSNAKLFEGFGVLVVDNIDSDDGKADLAAILTGAVTTQEQVAIDRASAIVTEDSGGAAGTVPWVLLALLAGGALVVLRGGMKPSRRG